MDAHQASLEGLEHRPAPRVIWRHWRFKLPTVLLELAVVVLVVVVFVPTLVEQPLFTADWVLRLLGIAGLMGLILFLLFLEMLGGLVRIANGRMLVPFPVPGPDGSTTHSIPLSDISDVAPQFDGLDVYLKSGRRLFLSRSSFGAGGVETIERLSGAFGKSFRESVERDLAQGFTPLVAKAKRVRGDTILLERPIDCYSDRAVWKVAPTDVRRVAVLDTPRSGLVYRIDLLDGTPLLLPRDDLERFGVFRSSSWATKLPSEGR